ncbi:MAG: tRNA(Met) cytidine acetyltransferase TmcA [Halobacteriaceae archaeon]
MTGDGSGGTGDDPASGAPTDTLAAAARALRAEARATNERRLLLLHGDRERTAAATARALDAAGVDRGAVALVGETDRAWAAERVPPRHADDLLGTERAAVVLDAHDTCRPNALGQVAGVVAGGGLLVVCAPPLDDWSAAACAFHRSLAVPPFDVEQVATRYHERLATLACVHPGVAVYDADADVLACDGLTDPAPRLVRPGEPTRPTPPADAAFPAAAYDACLTADQAEAVAALETLRAPAVAVVEADRGRGKSAAAGIAAACLAADGDSVLVTAPNAAAVAPLFERARALLETLGESTGPPPDDDGDAPESPVATVETAAGGAVAFAAPPEAAERVEDGDGPDVLVVDEAAALPVRLLERLLAAERVAYVSTVHGYEGAGRGFDVRFRGGLDDEARPVVEVRLDEPIRYAAGDPVEVWAFRVLALDASPAADQLVTDAGPATVDERALGPEDLLANEPLLRETVGLLVAAHYRTEPNDLARLLDAPNVSVRALTHDGHVASVALLGREGSLPADRRARMYEGERVPGNMLPDVLTSQLRDEAAGALAGARVLRIATHHAVRSRGLGSHLLDAVADALGEDLDWLGVGYGATPGLLSFWAANGYRSVHVSTRRNERSGEHSALMLRPTSPAGRELCARHAAAFADRIGPALADALDGLEPDVVRGVLRAAGVERAPDLDDRGWRLVAGAAFGPALYDVDPGPFRELALAHLLDPADPTLLDDGDERLLVAKVLQARPWGEVAGTLGYVSRAECMRALGRAYRPLVETYGGAVAEAERERFTGDGA